MRARRVPCRSARVVALSLTAALSAATAAGVAAGNASAATTGSPTSTTATTATTAGSTTSTTNPTPPPPDTSAGSASSHLTVADEWVAKAVTAEENLGSVRIEGKVTQGKNVIVLDLLVNGDGEGGGVLVQQGNVIKIERVGTLLYLNAPKRFWSTHATAAQTKTYGGKWIDVSALDSRFVSFDQFLNAADLVHAVFRGYATPLTVGTPTTFGRHKVVVVKDAATSNGTRTTGLMYIGTASPHDVYKIVDDAPGQKSTLVFNTYGKAVALTVPPAPINVS